MIVVRHIALTAEEDVISDLHIVDRADMIEVAHAYIIFDDDRRVEGLSSIGSDGLQPEMLPAAEILPDLHIFPSAYL